MATQSIFQAGNSPVVSIPRELFKRMNLKVGQEVTVEQIPDTNDLVIRTNSQKKQKTTSSVSKEFRRWLDRFLKEDKDLLVELSHR